MSTASQFLNALFSGRNLSPANLTSQPLSPTEAISLDAALRSDAASFFYSASVTCSCGVTSLQTDHYTWATVHFYYSVFYTLRSWLASQGHCLFYYQNRAFLIEAGPLQVPAKKQGASHDIVLREFRRLFPTNRFVVGTIDLMPALDWLKQRREEVNYRTERFPDPTKHSHFVSLKRYTLRRLAETYLTDRSLQWEFDPDHAMVALPIMLLERLRTQLSSRAIDITHTRAEENLLRRGTRDSQGPITILLRTYGVV